MRIDGNKLLTYLKLIREDMSANCKREADYIIEEIEAGSFNVPEPNEEIIEERMWIFERIAHEREFQNETHKFPEDIRLAVLVEEVGEVAKELQENDRNKINLRMELVQVAAIAVRWIEELENDKK